MKHIKLTIEHDIAMLCFDRPGSSANIFDEEVLTELDSAIHLIEENSLLKGVIFHSSKPSIFIAGADIKTLASASASEIHNLIDLGQSVFDRIADLALPTVAAIHGACVGGGYELALACDWRVASHEKPTQVGLPEVQLGLLPAWGGSTRLPILIGLPKALSTILGGKVYKAKPAKFKGMVDALCPKEKLLFLAQQYLKKGKRHHALHLKYHNHLSVNLIKNRAKHNIYKKTRGLYPAPLAALEVVCKGVLDSHSGSLHREAMTFTELAQSSEAKSLLRLFFLTERQKRLPVSKLSTKDIHQVAVVGAGVMGAGIGYWMASRNKTVTLSDISAEAVAKGLGNIERMTSQAVQRRVMNQTEADRLMDRIFASHNEVNLYHKDIVIEAAVEKLETKKIIFRDLATHTNANCILATNTSALPITELAKYNSNPERVVGIHFFNPVARMKLVEVVTTPYTSEEVLANTVNFVQSIGKLPVIVKDSPGFLVNRILLPYLVAAGEMFTDGLNPKEIDRKMLDFGMPMGPFRLLVEVGLLGRGRIRCP